MTVSYVLTTAAEADLRDIIRYTRKQWGIDQTRRYVAKLAAGIERIAAGQGMAKDLTAIHPGLRMVHCEHHFIFCLTRSGAPALMVAIFNENMDVLTRLAERLR